MAERKYLAASFPEEFGGLGLDPVSYGYFTEEIGKACCSTRALITVHTSLVGEALLRWGSREQKERWLPAMASGKKIGAFALSEPEIGSDARSVKTTYRKSTDGFIISGKKKWISFAHIADFFIVVAADGDQVTAFIVERSAEGVTTRPNPRYARMQSRLCLRNRFGRRSRSGRKYGGQRGKRLSPTSWERPWITADTTLPGVESPSPKPHSRPWSTIRGAGHNSVKKSMNFNSSAA